MANAPEEKLAVETNPRDTLLVDKDAIKRHANKLRRKKAHRRKLKRSHTKG